MRMMRRRAVSSFVLKPRLLGRSRALPLMVFLICRVKCVRAAPVTTNDLHCRHRSAGGLFKITENFSMVVIGLGWKQSVCLVIVPVSFYQLSRPSQRMAILMNTKLALSVLVRLLINPWHLEQRLTQCTGFYSVFSKTLEPLVISGEQRMRFYWNDDQVTQLPYFNNHCNS